MNINVGNSDRIARIAVGIVLIVLAATGIIGWWGYIGIVPILTGTFRFCPLYLPFGFSTNKCDSTPNK